MTTPAPRVTDMRDCALALSPAATRHLLEVTRALAAPFELEAMLAAVTGAARDVLRAERGSVWLHDAATDELVLTVASDLRGVRLPMGTGLVGASARHRCVVNVPDCAADPRFDPEIDRLSGFHTRCSLSAPLIDHEGGLVGVLQVPNRVDGTFGADDELLAEALAAQCAVALSRVRMMEAVLRGERLRRELELARTVQLSSLPAQWPALADYDMHAVFRPAEQTGGDTYDLALTSQGLLVVLGDASGHGIAPALQVVQMHAMLRMALRLGADLADAFREVNDQLARTLPTATSSPPSSACWTRRRTACASSAAARGRSCCGGAGAGNASCTRPRAFRWGPWRCRPSRRRWRSPSSRATRCCCCPTASSSTSPSPASPSGVGECRTCSTRTPTPERPSCAMRSSRPCTPSPAAPRRRTT